MDITALPSLTDLYEGADQWREVVSLLPVLVLLEVVLSADNAVALAAIARSGNNPERERLSLNIGITLALVLRIGLIVAAQWVLQHLWVQLVAAAYLMWLVFDHFWQRNQAEVQDNRDEKVIDRLPRSLVKTVILLAFTDLAFSIDSVAAAVAVSDQVILIATAAMIGIVALRFTSGLFIRWLDEYPRLETAGFLAVGFVSIRLILHVLFPLLNQPDWFTLLIVLVFFGWGLSIKKPDSMIDPRHAG
jgi:YkoY family integral membrane protein